MKVWKTICLVLIIIGGINWGLVGFLDYNLVDSIFGSGSMMARVIYAIVGIAAIALIVGKLSMPMMDDTTTNKRMTK